MSEEGSSTSPHDSSKSNKEPSSPHNCEEGLLSAEVDDSKPTCCGGGNKKESKKSTSETDGKTGCCGGKGEEGSNTKTECCNAEAVASNTSATKKSCCSSESSKKSTMKTEKSSCCSSGNNNTASTPITGTTNDTSRPCCSGCPSCGDACNCGENCQCTDELCRCEAEEFIHSLGAAKKVNPTPGKKVAAKKEEKTDPLAAPASPQVALAAPPTEPKTQAILKAELFITGMTCSMCSQAIETALQNNLPGIVSVQISLTTDSAEVQWCESKNSTPTEDIEKMSEIIEDIGYEVEEAKLLKSKPPSPASSPPASNKIPSSPSQNASQVYRNYSFSLDNANNNNGRNNLQEGEEESVEERWRRYRERQQRKVMQRRRAFLISLVGTAPILVLTMILPHILSTDAIFRHRHVTLFHKYNLQLEAITLWVLATPVQFFCGWDFYKMAWYGIRSGKAGMDVLVALGTTASYGYALAGVFWEDDHAAHFFETSAVLICFVLAGKWMQAVAVRRTSDALSALMGLQSKTAIKVTPLKDRQHFDPSRDPFLEETVPIQRVRVNDLVKVIRGASVPADGRVLYGEMMVDESMVTGESVPVLKTSGAVVLGGTICVETSATTINIFDESESSSSNSSDSSASSDSGDDEEQGQNICSSDYGDEEDPRQNIGAAFVQVTGVGSNTALAQIVQMVQQAQTRSVPIQSFADSVSAVFVPTVCAISMITYLVWYALCSSEVVPKSWYQDELKEDAATFSLMFAIACLVISCPCALGLATPTAVMVGTGVGASKCGVLMKGGQALEIASQVDSIVFDKTGTLTKGTPVVSDFMRINEANDNDEFKASDPLNTANTSIDDTYLLWLLASLERTSEHPLAKAVVQYVEEHMTSEERETRPLAQPSNFRALTGRGCRGSILVDLYEKSAFPSDKAAEIAVGNRSYAVVSGIHISQQADNCMKLLEQQGKTAIFGAVDGHVRVVLGIADELKPDARASILYLRNCLNVDVWMVTGDNARTAAAVSQHLDMQPDRVISEALPAAKLAVVRKLQAEGRVVAMVGDGVNDSPALAQADVGMSLGSGASEIAAEASDMVLVKGDVASVCTALHLSRAIFRRIQWNFLWSLLYNCLGIPVAAGVFYPIFHARLPPTVAALAMALSSVSVVLSSLTLRLYRPPNVEVEAYNSRHRRRSWRRAVPTRESSLLGTDDNELTVGLLLSDHLAASEATARTDNRSTSVSGEQ